MRLAPKQPNKYIRILKTFLISFLFFFLVYFLYNQRVNKFEFEGDLRYSDLSSIKVFALNLLKDQNILFFSKSNFEEQLKSENKEIKNIDYSIVSLDKIKIKISVVDNCCVLKDINENIFLISREGKIIKKLHESYYEDVISLNQEISEKDTLNIGLLFKLDEINRQFKSDKLKIIGFNLFNNYVEISLNDNSIIVIDETTNVTDLEKKYESLVSHLGQNNKKYSIVDFRFDKVIVK